MPRYVKHIEAEGVLGRFDIDQEFQEGVNVLYGKNGTGKTTLLPKYRTKVEKVERKRVS